MSLLASILASALAATSADAAPPRIGWPSEENPAWDCGNAGGQIAINRCYRERNQGAEAQMDAAWEKFVRYFIPDGEEAEPPIVEEQQEAQIAFLTYRDIHCQTRSQSQMGGSASDMVLYACLAELTEMRAQQLAELPELF